MDRSAILKQLLGVFGLLITVVGIGLLSFTIRHWSVPPYGLAGGLVAVTVGVSVLGTAYPDLEL